MMKRLIPIFVLIFCLVTSSDVLYLNNGEELDGKLITIDSNKIIMEIEGKTKTIPIDQAMRMELVKYREIKGEYNLSQIKDKRIRDIIKNAPDASKYPSASKITLLDETNITVDENYLITRKTRTIEKIFRERAKGSTAQIAGFFSQGESTNKLVFGRTVNNSKIYYVDDFSIKTSSVNPYYPEYDREKRTRADLPKADIGSIVDYSFEYKQLKRNVFDQVDGFDYYNSYEPVLNKIITFTFPAKFEDRFYFKNYRADDLKVKKTRNNRSITYSFVMDKIEPEKQESSVPYWSTFYKYIYFGLRKESFKDQVKALQGKIRKSEIITPELENIVNKLTEGMNTPYEKLKALYTYVAREVQYVGVSMSSYEYYPRPVSEVLKFKRGNSLDKMNLFRVMLKMAGIDATLVYTANAYIPYNKEFPWIENFSGVRVKAIIDGNSRYYTPIGTTSNLSDEFVGNDIILDVSQGKVTVEPFADPSIFLDVENIQAKLDKDGTMYMDVKRVFEGGTGASYRKYRFMKQDEIRKEMEKWVKGYHSNAKLISWKFENLDSVDKQVRVEVNMEIPEYAMRTGDKILMFKLPFGFSASSVGEKTRYHDYDLPGSRFRNKFHVELQLPSEYSVYYVPGSNTFGIPGYFSVISNSSVQGNDLKFDYVYNMEKDFLEKEKYPEYKSIMEKMARWSDEYIVLEKK